MKSKKVMEARINRAVVGFRIPMMSIPKLYSQLERAVTSGMDDDHLRCIVAGFPGVELA